MSSPNRHHTAPTRPELLLGWTEPSAQQAARKPIWDEGEDHLVTIAPTGAGKGVSCAIPALLSWPGPAVVIDPKAEAYHVTASYRRSIGQRIHLLDPFGVTGQPIDRLNPLDIIDMPTGSASDEAATLANLMSDGVRSLKEPFWDDRAAALIASLILHVKTIDGQNASLATVRSLINAPRRLHESVAAAMHANPDPEVAVGAGTLSLPGNTYGGIIATASAHTSFLRNGPVANSIKSSTISLDAIRDGDPLTLYLVLPPDKLISHGRLLRLWLGVIISTLTSRRHIPAVSTLLLIDEAAQLGFLDQLLTAVTLLRGYGVKVWSFWQDLAQLSELYPRNWQTLLNNCRCQQYFAPASPAAAQQLHDYLAGSNPRSLLDLKPDQTLLSRSGSRPQIIRRANYLRDPMFADRFDPNPFYTNRTPHAHAKEPWGANVIALCGLTRTDWSNDRL